MSKLHVNLLKIEKMAKLYFKTRDTLLAIDLESIAVVKAEGNYTRLYYINQHEVLLTLGISRLEEILLKHKTENSHFVRLGRSMIVNHAYLQKIDLQKQILELSDKGLRTVRVTVAKPILKSYKDAVEKSIIIKKEQLYENRNR